MYACVNLIGGIYECVHVRARVYVCGGEGGCICACVCACVNVRVYVCMFALCVCVSAYACVRVYICVEYVCLYACVCPRAWYVCMYVCCTRVHVRGCVYSAGTVQLVEIAFINFVLHMCGAKQPSFLPCWIRPCHASQVSIAYI